MTETHENPVPWADVFLPAPLDAREIYEYATSVGAERRGQRRRRQVVLSICGCLVVALTATGVSLSGGDGAQTSIRLATQAIIPRAPAHRNRTVPASRHRGAASPAPQNAPAPPAPPMTSQCPAFAQVTAFHVLPLPILDTTTTTTPPPPDTTTTTTPPPPDTTTTTAPPPPTTTPSTQQTTPPSTNQTTPPTQISPDTAIVPPVVSPGDAPLPPSPLSLRPRRTQC
jgi:hypothetical protein